MKINIRELLRHVYPSCKVKVFELDNEFETNVSDYYDMVYEDECTDDYAFYKDFLAIFIA